jgi:toxin ParE1/3/4
MGYKLEVGPLAAIEIIEAYDWYELQKEGLGLIFLNELEQFYFTLIRNPLSYSYYYKPVREGKIK